MFIPIKCTILHEPMIKTQTNPKSWCFSNLLMQQQCLVFLSCILLSLKGINANLEEHHYDLDPRAMIMTIIINNITFTITIILILILTSS